MCSRYYIDLDMMEEISRVVQNIDGRIRLTQGDIRPTDVAPVIGQSEHGLELGMCRWGYPLSKGKNPVINARVETVMDKPSFQNGNRHSADMPSFVKYFPQCFFPNLFHFFTMPDTDTG